jgi:hypothetical protein
MPDFKLDSITYEDLRHAAAVVRYIADRSPSIEEFEDFARLLEGYAELADLYRQMHEDERMSLELAEGQRGFD